ncbi:Wzz/FepE/Etk N-terminal domain-containing protein [Mycobacterium sp. B14F4]|uniref:Wzz/FepE/Etk N-terminal domain-containing protein n=1 Tax=Mycobacterium sp. B14F4 TaxID=3153565 RepID=UPI00325DCA58
MEIQELWRILRERWLIVVIVTLLCVIGSLAWYFLRPLEYRAQTRVVVSTSGGTGTAVDAYAGERVAQLRAPSYAELLRGPEVALRASRKLDGQISPSDIQGAIGTRTAPDQPLITVTAEASDPGTAIRIVEAVQNAFREYVAEIERPGATGALTSVQITTDEPTVRPEGHWKRDTVIAGLIGFVVGTLIAVVRDRTDPVMRKSGQLSSIELPYLGTVGSSTGSLDEFRRIALECLINAEPHLGSRLLVVSVDAESPSSTIARGMAEALGSYGKKVMLVDVADSTDASAGPGWSDYLAGIVEWGQAGTPSGMPNVTEVRAGSDGQHLDAYFLAGRLPQTPLPLRRGEYAVLAGPSIVHTPLAVALTSVADAALLVATTKSTRLADIEEAKYTLEAMKLPALGVVFLRPDKKKTDETVVDGELEKDEVGSAS